MQPSSLSKPLMTDSDFLEAVRTLTLDAPIEITTTSLKDLDIKKVPQYQDTVQISLKAFYSQARPKIIDLFKALSVDSVLVIPEGQELEIVEYEFLAFIQENCPKIQKICLGDHKLAPQAAIKLFEKDLNSLQTSLEITAESLKTVDFKQIAYNRAEDSESIAVRISLKAFYSSHKTKINALFRAFSIDSITVISEESRLDSIRGDFIKFIKENCPKIQKIDVGDHLLLSSALEYLPSPLEELRGTNELFLTRKEDSILFEAVERLLLPIDSGSLSMLASETLSYKKLFSLAHYIYENDIQDAMRACASSLATLSCGFLKLYTSTVCDIRICDKSKIKDPIYSFCQKFVELLVKKKGFSIELWIEPTCMQSAESAFTKLIRKDEEISAAVQVVRCEEMSWTKELFTSLLQSLPELTTIEVVSSYDTVEALFSVAKTLLPESMTILKNKANTKKPTFEQLSPYFSKINWENSEVHYELLLELFFQAPESKYTEEFLALSFIEIDSDQKVATLQLDGLRKPLWLEKSSDVIQKILQTLEKKEFTRIVQLGGCFVQLYGSDSKQYFSEYFTKFSYVRLVGAWTQKDFKDVLSIAENKKIAIKKENVQIKVPAAIYSMLDLDFSSIEEDQLCQFLETIKENEEVIQLFMGKLFIASKNPSPKLFKKLFLISHFALESKMTTLFHSSYMLLNSMYKNILSFSPTLDSVQMKIESSELSLLDELQKFLAKYTFKSFEVHLSINDEASCSFLSALYPAITSLYLSGKTPQEEVVQQVVALSTKCTKVSLKKEASSISFVTLIQCMKNDIEVAYNQKKVIELGNIEALSTQDEWERLFDLLAKRNLYDIFFDCCDKIPSNLIPQLFSKNAPWSAAYREWMQERYSFFMRMDGRSKIIFSEKKECGEKTEELVLVAKAIADSVDDCTILLDSTVLVQKNKTLINQLLQPFVKKKIALECSFSAKNDSLDLAAVTPIIKSLQYLHTLKLHGIQGSIAPFIDIASCCPEITTFAVTNYKEIEANKVSFAKVLQSLKKLIDLSLEDNQNLTNETFLDIVTTTTLKRLDLSGCTLLTDAILSKLSSFSQLRSLNLSGCKVSFQSDSLVIGKLEELILFGCSEITDNSLKNIAPYDLSLKSLNLAMTSITLQGLRSLAPRAPLLEKLSLAHCEHLTDKDIAALFSMTHKFLLLKELNLSGIGAITEKSLQSIVEASRSFALLNRVNVHGSAIALPAILEILHPSSSMLKIENDPVLDDSYVEFAIRRQESSALEVVNCPKITAECIKEFIKVNPKLELISLAQMGFAITDDILTTIGLHAKNLKTLILLTKNSQITRDGVEKMLQMRPELQSITLQRSKMIPASAEHALKNKFSSRDSIKFVDTSFT